MTVIPANNHSFVELYVSDLKIVETFYQKLGFKTVWKTESYLVLKFDQSLIGFLKKDIPEPRGVGVEIVIQIESIDIKDYFEKCQKLGIKIAEPLTFQYFKKWDFRLTDPFGYYLRFTEPENILYP